MQLIRLALCFALVSCGGTYRYNKKQAQKSLKELETGGFVIGEFALGSDAVLDGDTIRVQGVKTTIRLLGIDTEETFKNKVDLNLALADFEDYLKQKRGDRIKPVKAGTPMGEEAKKYCADFLYGVDTVRLERDREKEVRGRYGRYLAYVFVTRDGKEYNYNVESVRAGMTPYFMKYGYSARFHDEFEQAQKEARAAKRGIWNPDKQAYRDYDERLVWWRARADFIKQFEQTPGGIRLTAWDALQRLEQAAKTKREVRILGNIANIKLGDTGPTKVMLARRRGSDFPLVFFDKDLFASLGLSERRGEFLEVRGVVTDYKNKYTGKRVLQMMIERPSQIKLGPVPYLDKPEGKVKETPS